MAYKFLVLYSYSVAFSNFIFRNMFLIEIIWQHLYLILLVQPLISDFFPIIIENFQQKNALTPLGNSIK